MLTFPSNQRVFLACGSTDLRKSIDGLAPIVQESFGHLCNHFVIGTYRDWFFSI
ncbi:IS66 family insertion sequence element accessory protein TnpB [Paenibacillus harenae]|uniref:IS66 family insertion sequence element accessory protein TnpB n=1 Tax=Paenibacillus harenae TaxID=306543 RepID=UPI003592EC7A